MERIYTAATMPVGHAIKLLETIIDSQSVFVANGRAHDYNALLNYFVTQDVIQARAVPAG